MAGLPGGTPQKKEKPGLSPSKRLEDERVRVNYKENQLLGLFERQVYSMHYQNKALVARSEKLPFIWYDQHHPWTIACHVHPVAFV